MEKATYPQLRMLSDLIFRKYDMTDIEYAKEHGVEITKLNKKEASELIQKLLRS